MKGIDAGFDNPGRTLRELLEEQRADAEGKSVEASSEANEEAADQTDASTHEDGHNHADQSGSGAADSGQAGVDALVLSHPEVAALLKMEVINRSSLVLEERTAFTKLRRRKEAGLAYVDEEVLAERRQKQTEEAERSRREALRRTAAEAEMTRAYLARAAEDRETSKRINAVVIRRGELRSRRQVVEREETVEREGLIHEADFEFFGSVLCRYTNLHKQVFELEEVWGRKKLTQRAEQIFSQLEHLRNGVFRIAAEFERIEDEHSDQLAVLFSSAEMVCSVEDTAEGQSIAEAIVEEELLSVVWAHAERLEVDGLLAARAEAALAVAKLRAKVLSLNEDSNGKFVS